MTNQNESAAGTTTQYERAKDIIASEVPQFTNISRQAEGVALGIIAAKEAQREGSLDSEGPGRDDAGPTR